MEDLINNSDFLAYKFNFNTENIEFLPISREEIRRVSALKLEYIDANRQLIPVPLSKLVTLLNNSNTSLKEKPPRFIFHTAFCASTFLSRCLDVDGMCVNLREPQILLDAANAKRLQWQSKTTSLDYRQFPTLALLLLQKHASSAEKLIIKPINSVNNIIPELLQITAATNSLILFTDVKNFLLSTLRKGEEGKHVIRAMFDLLRCDFQHLSNLSTSSMIHMTDLNIILTLWRLQIEQIENVLKNFSSSGKIASLYGEKLISNPVGAVHAANHFLELQIPPQEIDNIVKSDILFKDAKTDGERFSVEKRKAVYQKLEDFYGIELDNGLNWMTKNNPTTKLIPELGSALEF